MIVQSPYWSDIEDDRPFSQGDVLRSSVSIGDGKPSFGLVITADCDIVQQKAADRLTFVEVVSTRDYLESIWAPDQLQRFVRKQGRIAAEAIAGVMRRSKLDYCLDEAQLLEWLRQRPVAVVERAVNRTGKPFDAKLAQNLEALRCALRAERGRVAIDDWRALRTILGDSPDRQRTELAAAMTGGGFADFFTLPDLPGTDGVGYVALLRFIRTVRANEVFTNAVDARVAGQPDALVRVGRLADGIRFSITQKLAFLFSRIGLPAHFEDACKSAAVLSAETIIPGA